MKFMAFLRPRVESFFSIRMGGTLARVVLATGLVPLLVCATHSRAPAGTVTVGQSNAYGIQTTISATVPLVGSTTIDLSAQPTVSGTAPAPYSNTNTLASISAGVSGIATLSTGTLDVAASSTVNGVLSSPQTNASSTVEGLSTSIGPLGALLSITSGDDVLKETAAVTGTYGSLSTAGALTLSGTTDLVIQVLGITEVTITPGATIAANDTIDLGALGTIILNHQVADTNSNGVSFAGITASFLDLELTLALAGASAMVNITIDDTHASENAVAGAVPEPSSIVLAGIGAIALFGTVKRTRRSS
jgi:hypothetical protein